MYTGDGFPNDRKGGRTVHDHVHFQPEGAHRLNNPRRLERDLSEQDLARFLSLRGDEDLIDLGSGTGFYTDRMAALTTGVVYAVELQPEMTALYRERGVPANVRLIPGDVTQLSLPPASADVACCIATYHETEGRLDLPGLSRILRPGGRLVIVDWRKDAESWESGPPEEIRYTKEEVAGALSPYFKPTQVENLGRFMFAVVADRED
jgi:SAM-dependent methyltransferase